ncbi:MAG: hypothetical protein LBL72_10730 [Candidatus Accumulibacter sp.]|jgi:hypothetical protein|nr:hypothetical protein [Accumulibacter sp.]
MVTLPMKLKRFLSLWGTFIVFSAMGFWFEEILWICEIWRYDAYFLPLLVFGILHVALAANVLVQSGARAKFTAWGLASSVAGIAFFLFMMLFFMKLWVLFFLSIVLAFWVIVRSGAKRSAIAGVILGLFIGQISFFETAYQFLSWTIAGFV